MNSKDVPAIRGMLVICHHITRQLIYLRASYSARNLTRSKAGFSTYTNNPVVDEFSTLECEHCKSRLPTSSISCKINQKHIFSSRILNIHRTIDLKGNCITCVSIRLISSTKVYVTIRCFREKERAFSLPVTNPVGASFLDLIPSWGITQHNEMISSRLFALAYHNLKSFIEISGIKSCEEHLCSKTLYLSNDTIAWNDFSASLRIKNGCFSVWIYIALASYKGIVSSCHEGIKTVLLSSVHYIYRIILLTLSNLDEYILHRQILSRNIYICTMGCDLNSLLYYYSN